MYTASRQGFSIQHLSSHQVLSGCHTNTEEAYLFWLPPHYDLWHWFNWGHLLFFFFRDRTLSVTIYCSFHVRVHNLHTRSLSHHWWCSRIQSYVCGTWEIPESPLWDENSELCGTFTHLIWDAIPWLSVTHCPYFKNRMWGTPSKTIFYSFISGTWVKIWLRPNGTAECGPWGRPESSIVFITPAPRIKFFHCRFHFSVNRTLFFAVIEGVPFTVVPYDSGLRV